MTIPTPSRSSWSSCEPRFATRRSDRETLGGEIARIAEAFGQPLMPWQRYIAEVGGELLPDGRPAFREVVCTVPRQSGKTTLMLAWEVQRALLWGRPQSIAYTAQTGQDARMKLIEDQYDKILALSPLKQSIRQAKRAMGATALVFKNGSRIDALATSAEAGHGKTLDLAVIDEAMADEDDRREQALLPTMATRADAQLLVFSTAGTDRSVLLRRKVDAGRAAVAEGVSEGIAYFEWSADENADPDDRDVWRGCMPALGHTITEGTVEHARRTMSDGEFRRAYLNQWVSADERIIPVGAWLAVQDERAAPSRGLVLSADAKPGLGAAAIAVADENGHVELIHHENGVTWVEDRLVELAERHDARIVIDAGGSLGFLVERLEARRLAVVSASTGDYVNAVGSFFSNVMDKRLRVRPHAALDAAVANARKRKVRDAWVWARQDTEADISPLVAATLASGEALKSAANAEIGVMFV
jgi:hypothetical protein